MRRMDGYRFESANMGTVEVDIIGEWADGSCDIQVRVGDAEAILEECDDADEVMSWLVAQGVGFESRRSMAFNRAVVQGAMIDGDNTVEALLDRAALWGDEEIESKLQFI